MLDIVAHVFLNFFLPRDATQSAVFLRQIVRPTVCDVELSWSRRLEYFENNLMADQRRLSSLCRLQRHGYTLKETPRNLGPNMCEV